MHGRGLVEQERRITLAITNEDMNNIIRAMKWLEHFGVLIDGVSETVKNEKKRKGRFLGMLLGTLVALIINGNMLTGNESWIEY